MLILWPVLGLVAFVVTVSCFGLLGTGNPSRLGPGETLTQKIAGQAAVIAKLHRELGVDPIYDPGPYLPQPVQVIEAVSREEAEAFFQNAMPVGAPLTAEPAPPPTHQGKAGKMTIFTCPRCDWALIAGGTLGAESFKRHWWDRHSELSNGAPIDYDG